MFRTLIYPSSVFCVYSVELPHWSYCSWLDVCWSFGVVGLEWYPCCRLKRSSASACNTDTTPTQSYRNSNTHRTKNNTTNVVIQQNRRKILMMDILMSETCWAHKKWNKIASDIKLVFYSSTIAMMYGPINIKSVNFFQKGNFTNINTLRLASFRENFQWLKFLLNGLRAQSKVSPAVLLLPLASWSACFGMAFPPFLVKQLYPCDSVVISSFVRTGHTTRRWGWLLGRIGYRITVG